ncbi:MAG: helix-turn-helix domain-containing protein [Deltaproteobacteria bacterium]|nr:helix-turn-helix domain-containing protein [Deltaproteobacteria bacterium]
MNFLDTYPEILTVDQIAEILKVEINMVYRLSGLVKIRIGKGRGLIRYRKIDLVNYIKSREEDVNLNANKKTERYRKVGLSDMFSWKEIKTIRLEYQR